MRGQRWLSAIRSTFRDNLRGGRRRLSGMDVTGLPVGDRKNSESNTAVRDKGDLRESRQTEECEYERQWKMRRVEWAHHRKWTIENGKWRETPVVKWTWWESTWKRESEDAKGNYMTRLCFRAALWNRASQLFRFRVLFSDDKPKTAQKCPLLRWKTSKNKEQCQLSQFTAMRG